MILIADGLKKIWALPDAGSEAHVWRAGLDLPEPDIRSAGALLCDEEKKRAARLFFPQYRRRFIAAHAALRLVLCRYLDIAPEKINIVSGEYGKPGLALKSAHRSICFNLSHSNGVAIMGVAAGRAIGVDIERVRPVPGIKGICSRFFTEQEARLIESADDNTRTALFFRLWTMKEACLKASGLGLRGLGGLSSITGGMGAAGSHVPDAARIRISGRSWSVRRIFTMPGFEAAVALKENDSRQPGFREMESVF